MSSGSTCRLINFIHWCVMLVFTRFIFLFKEKHKRCDTAHKDQSSINEFTSI